VLLAIVALALHLHMIGHAGPQPQLRLNEYSSSSLLRRNACL